MNNPYIRNLIAKGEGQDLDFKYYISSASKIAKTLVAFANSSGGRLLIGVKDNGNIVGVESEEEVYMIQLAAERYCRPEVKLEMTSWDTDGLVVLEVYVAPGNEKPYYAKDDDGKWLVYIRKEDKNLLANKVLVEVFKRKRSDKANIIRYDLPESFLLDYLSEHKQITFGQFCRLAKIRPYIAERVLVNLVAIKMIEVHHTSQGDYFVLKQGSGARDQESGVRR
jgi:predicted HTH transcriptional regulator